MYVCAYVCLKMPHLCFMLKYMCMCIMWNVYMYMYMDMIIKKCVFWLRFGLSDIKSHERRQDKYRNWFVVSWISYLILLFIYESAMSFNFL